jgi:PAS domain S-box-containing protein
VTDQRVHQVVDETALRESEERFRLLVEGTRDYAIFMLDTTGHIVSWNAGAERIKGYTHDEIIGRHFSTFYTEEDLADGKPARELKIAVATGKYEEEGWRLRMDGSRFWASVLITALWDKSGRLRGFGKVTRDLTERRRLEQNLLEKNAAGVRPEGQGPLPGLDEPRAADTAQCYPRLHGHDAHEVARPPQRREGEATSDGPGRSPTPAVVDQ